MGWTYYETTRKSMIDDLTRSWGNALPTGGRVETTTIAKCFRGNIRFSGRLWAVHQQVTTDAGGKVLFCHRFLMLYLMRCHTRAWGYKDISEGCGPYEVDCPKSYLELTRHSPDLNKEWRESVEAFHARRRAKREEAKRNRLALKLERSPT